MPDSHENYPQAIVPDLPHRRLLEGQTAIVTGASSGIGRAVAVSLGGAGAKVSYDVDETDFFWSECGALPFPRVAEEVCIVLFVLCVCFL